MRFLGFSIKNFKGINDLTFKLGDEKRIYTFVGLNESGKTSILEAINVFANDIATNERHKYIPKSQKFDFNDRITISADIELSDSEQKEVLEFVEGKGFSEINLGKKLKITRSYTFENSSPKKLTNTWDFVLTGKKNDSTAEGRIYDIENQVWQEAVTLIKENFFPKIIYYPNFLFDFPEKIYLETRLNEQADYKKYRDVIQDILLMVNANLTVEKDILPKLQNPTPQNEEVLDLLLAKMSEKVSHIVFSAWEKLFSRGNKEIVIKHGKEYENYKFVYYLQFKLKEGADQFFISERSLGFKWFFSFLLFTGIRKSRTSDKSEVLFLLDEPASNLHSTAQVNLLSTFDEILSKYSLIYTTHSHHLINPDWLHGMYIVKNKAINYNNDLNYIPSVTDIEIIPYKKFVSKYPNQREYFQPILDTLDYQPGLIEKIPSIVIVEGKNDFFTLNYLNKLYFENRYLLHFYPGGGATSDEQIIRLYIAWNRKFIILRDSDKEGKKAIAAYEKMFPVFGSNRFYTFQDVDENLDSISLEDFFKDEEKQIIMSELNKVETIYNKSLFNLSVQFLLAEKRKVSLSSDTLNKFEILFNFLFEKMEND